ncbi:MAG: FAD-binding oxidoreductase [Chthoniobacter sp.]|uniref:FAD-binding oxidoreductase n=1 Tax=Chthoniobacter sp. TaxID=2510640 RepID=UPI0032A987EA
MTHTRRTFIRTSATAGAALFAEALGAREPKHAPPPPAEPPRQTEDVIFLTPTDPAYAAARQAYNAGILLRPNSIALCATEAGVQKALQRARAEKWPVAVKSGGHSFEGFSLNDDGLVVGVSPMRDLHLDAHSGLLTAGAGCRLRDVNLFLLPQGRFLPAGSCATVGLAGLTLGGGYGMFARKFGLTCDHLRSFRMVDGTGAIHDSADDPDLLWAARGGGNGHFGIVTQLTLQTRPVPKAFSSWRFRAYHLDEIRATALLDAWFKVTAALPDDAFSAWIMNGSQVTILLTTVGSREEKGVVAARRQLTALTNKASAAPPVPLAKSIPWYYGGPGPEFFKNTSAGYYRGMDDIRSALPGIFFEVLTKPGLVFQINTMGGAIGKEGADGAYPHRAYSYLGEAQAYWDSPFRASNLRAAIGRIRDHIAQAGITGHYANYPDLAFQDWPTAYYGRENYQRLQTLKKRYDPEDRIRHPQSVRLPS